MNTVMRGKHQGFTLVEIVMVLFIIALLTSIVVVRFDQQRAQSMVHVTKANLESLRTAVAIFYEAEGTWPVDDLSDLVSGAPSGTQYLGLIPPEKITNDNTVVNVASYSGGWIFDLSTHDIHPNLSGTDVNGEAYSSY